jgi:hypothetical protein
VEDLDTCSTACDAAESNQTEGVELLMKITQDRGELLRAMRQNYIAQESILTPAGSFFSASPVCLKQGCGSRSNGQLQRQTLLIDEDLRNRLGFFIIEE